MTAWQQWEGQTIDGVFPLLRYLGGSAGGAVFLTEYGETNPQRAAIKLIPADQVDAGRQLSAWEAASTLSHPHLIQIFAGGQCRTGEHDHVYVVMEYADENLSQVLSDRVLTEVEAREMLAPLADALSYVHGKGFAHGHVTPSNIMALGEQVKLSSDTLQEGGSPADDVRSVGVVLREALTPRIRGRDGARLPEPFAEIVGHCLEPDPQKRWTMAQISARLAGQGRSHAAPPPAAAQKASRWWIAALAAVFIVALGGWLMRAPRSTPSSGAVSVQPAAAVETNPPAEKPNAVNAAGPASPANPANPAKPANPAGAAPAGGGILSRAMPDIPQKARNTISGKVTVNVKVSVDPSGSVQDATLERPRSSKYLSDRAVAAARLWKFEPASVPQEWLLRFELYRDRTTVSPSRLGAK